MRFSEVLSKFNHPCNYRIQKNIARGKVASSLLLYRKYRYTRQSRRGERDKSSGWRIARSSERRKEERLIGAHACRNEKEWEGCERVGEIHGLSVTRRPDQCRSVSRSAWQVAHSHSPLRPRSRRRKIAHANGDKTSFLRPRVLQRPRTCRSIHSTSRPVLARSRDPREPRTAARVLPSRHVHTQDHDRTSSGTDQ